MRDPQHLTDEHHAGVVRRLKRRADFVAAGKGKRWHGKTLSVQANRAAGADVRIGFTLTRKVGNAVVRNRARRRLKDAVRLAPDLPFRAGYDYVIIGRVDAVRVAFADLVLEVSRAIGAVHGAARGARRPSGTGPRGPG